MLAEFASHNMLFWYAKLNKIVDPKYSATVMTLCSSVYYAGEQLTKTIGLELVHIVRSYYRMVITCLIASIFTLTAAFFLSRKLDELQPEDFKVDKEAEKSEDEKP